MPIDPKKVDKGAENYEKMMLLRSRQLMNEELDKPGAKGKKAAEYYGGYEPGSKRNRAEELLGVIAQKVNPNTSATYLEMNKANVSGYGSTPESNKGNSLMKPSASVQKMLKKKGGK